MALGGLRRVRIGRQAFWRLPRRCRQWPLVSKLPRGVEDPVGCVEVALSNVIGAAGERLCYLTARTGQMNVRSGGVVREPKHFRVLELRGRCCSFRGLAAVWAQSLHSGG